MVNLQITTEKKTAVSQKVCKTLFTATACFPTAFAAIDSVRTGGQIVLHNPLGGKTSIAACVCIVVILQDVHKQRLKETQAT